MADASGNLVIMNIPSKNPSAVSCTLSGIEHEYRPGEIIMSHLRGCHADTKVTDQSIPVSVTSNLL